MKKYPKDCEMMIRQVEEAEREALLKLRIIACGCGDAYNNFEEKKAKKNERKKR